MPGPAVYIVVAVISAAAAGLAFKEFVYDPHLAPKVDEWSARFAAYRRERHRKRAAPYTSMPPSDKVASHNVRADVELESMVERETHTFSDGSATLRRRNVTSADGENTLILEKSNPNIPFDPLTPTSPSSPLKNPFTDFNDLAVSLRRLSIGSVDNSSPPSEALPSMSHSRLRATDAPLDTSTANVLPPASASSFIIPTSSRTLISPPTQDNIHSRGTSPFTNIDDSRSGTPFTDVASNHSFADIRSGTPFSDFAPSETSFASYNNDVEEQMASSFVLSSAASGGSDSEAGSHSNQRLMFARSPQLSSRLSDEVEEWDRLSE